MKIHHKPCYRKKREAEYPSLSDLADALYWHHNGDGAPLAAYLAKVQDVKDRYPKPAAEGPDQG